MANTTKNYKILTNFKEIELYNSISDIKEKNTFISSNALTIYNNIINILKDTDVNDIISMRNNLNNINYISHDESDIYFDNNYRDNDYSEFAELLNTIIEKLEEDDNFDNYSRELLVQLQTKINGVLANIYTNNNSNDGDIENLKQSVEESLSSNSVLNEKYGNTYNELKDENTGNIIRQYEDPKNYKIYAAQILNIIECKKTYIAPSESSNTYTIIVGPTNSGDEPEPQPEAPDTIDVNGVTYYKVQPQSPGENYRLDTYHSDEWNIDYYAWINKVTPTLTVNNPASTTIADGGTTTITITSSVPGLLRFSHNNSTAAGGNNTAWTWTITPTSTATTSFTITITNNTAVTEQSTISTNGIKVTFTPSDTTNYNTVSDINAIRQQITLSAAQQSTSYYWYVGTTKPQSLNEASIVDSYQSETIYTNTSGVKSHIFVLTNDDKNVTFINPELNSPVSQVTIDTTTILGYNIFETAVGTAINGNIKILVSDVEIIP